MILVASATTVFTPTVRQTFDDLKEPRRHHAARSNSGRGSQHDFLTLEHIVLAMIDDPDGKELMQACGVDLEQLGETLTLFIDEEMSELSTPMVKRRAQPKVAVSISGLLSMCKAVVAKKSRQ